jgi:argininosuccinate lyase
MTSDTKLWGGRFTGAADAGFAEFNRSFDFDRRLFWADVRASQAHCRGLLGAGVLEQAESDKICGALDRMVERAGTNPDFFVSPGSEDVHSFIESRLIEAIGDTGRKLHTGRSRNDQVATAMRLWLCDETDRIIEDVRLLQAALVDLAEQYLDAVIPGYTHLQRAQPVLWAHWCLAYFEMLARDRDRLKDVRGRVNVLPLGSAALAGTAYTIDREAVARELGFAAVSRNSLDAVSDRDFCVEFAAAGALIMTHLSRLAEDIILYSSAEFGFIELGDAVATGSSLMPQKKNPDSMELVRGKSGRVVGHLVGLLTMLKGLPLAYNKDMQEDKEAVFDTADTLRGSLSVSTTVLRNLKLREDRASAAAQTGYLNATELADYLAKKGIPFREGHELVGRIVLHAIERGVELNGLSLEELRGFSPVIDDDVFAALSLERTLDSKDQLGGTSRRQVAAALAQARAYLAVTD